MSLVVLSSRGFYNELLWRNIAPPLEDALSSKPDTTVVLPPGFRRPSLRPESPSWLRAIRTVRRADAVFWLQLHFKPPGPVWALAYAKPEATRAALTIDSFPAIYFRLVTYARAQRLAHWFLLYRDSVLALKSAAPNRHFEGLPIGFNDRVFRDQGLERDIYALWLGRRYEPLHSALQAYCAERGLHYEYLEPPGRYLPLDELSRLVARSRYFVAIPADIEDPIRTGGLSTFAMRYLEGVGAGCRLLGAKPRSGEFDLMLPDDAIVECAPDGSDLAAVLEAADADPAFEQKGRAASAVAHANHTWSHRANWIYSRLDGGPEQDLFSVTQDVVP